MTPDPTVPLPDPRPAREWIREGKFEIEVSRSPFFGLWAAIHTFDPRLCRYTFTVEIGVLAWRLRLTRVIRSTRFPRLKP